MAQDIVAELCRVQEELRVVKAELAALSRVVEESVLFQTLVAVDAAGESSERARAAIRVLRKVADMRTVK